MSRSTLVGTNARPLPASAQLHVQREGTHGCHLRLEGALVASHQGRDIARGGSTKGLKAIVMREASRRTFAVFLVSCSRTKPRSCNCQARFSNWSRQHSARGRLL